MRKPIIEPRRIILPYRVQVSVCSRGGAGTTMLMDYLSTYRKVNYHNDLTKHSMYPTISFNPEIRSIFVFSNPIDTVISLFRRGMAGHKITYAHRNSRLMQWGMAGSQRILDKKTFLEEYAATGIDKLCIRRQFHNWYYGFLPHPTLFIRYETIWDNLDILAKFLNLTQDQIDNFPLKRQRESQTMKSHLSPEAVDGLHKMYGEFARELEQLNDAEIRGEKRPRSVLIKTCFKAPYFKRVCRQILIDSTEIFRIDYAIIFKKYNYYTGYRVKAFCEDHPKLLKWAKKVRKLLRNGFRIGRG